MNELRSMHNNPLDSNFLALSYTVGWSITHRPFAGGSPEAGGKADTLYDLCGVANHRGTAENGHCYAFVKDSAGSGGGYGGAGDAGGNAPWYQYDDSHVTQIEGGTELVSRTAYVLFYVRRSKGEEGGGQSGLGGIAPASDAVALAKKKADDAAAATTEAEQLKIESAELANTKKADDAVAANDAAGAARDMPMEKAVTGQDQPPDGAQAAEPIEADPQRVSEALGCGSESGVLDKAQAEMAEVKQRMSTLRQGKDGQLKPLKAELETLNKEQLDINHRRRELESELAQLSDRAEAGAVRIEKLQTRQQTVQAEYRRQVGAVDSNHHSLASVIRREEERNALTSALQSVDTQMIESEEQAASAASAVADVDASADQIAKGGECFAETAAAYFSFEAECLSFMRDRVSNDSVELAKLEKELVATQQLGLGMKAVVASMETKAAATRKNVSEDSATVRALEHKARSVFTGVKNLSDQAADPLGSKVCQHLAAIKNIVPSLGLANLGDADWTPPAPPALGSKSPKPFDAGTAASLGLSALLPKAAREEPMESKHPGQPQRPPPQQQPKMEPIKLSWLSAKAPVAAVPMKSMAEIQAEEEERADRVTQENLARIDQGIAPVALGESKDD